MLREDGRDGPDPNHDRSSINLRTEFDRDDLARHLALFYQSTNAQLRAVTTYISHGLQSDHRCLYLVDINTPDRIKEALRTADIDVEGRIESGDLMVRDASEVYLNAGFNPNRMISTLEEECRASLADGYQGLWVAGENTWCFKTDMSFDYILDFEADFDATCPDLPVTALCQYDLAEFSEESMAKVLWTHKQIIYRNTICDNPFYVPPEKYRKSADPHLNAQLMLEQAYNLTQARRQVNQREQRLSVLNRALRHDIKNELQVVQAALEFFEDAEDLNPKSDNRRQVALDHVENILELSEKARYVQQTISDPAVERVALDSVIEQAISDVRVSHPEAEINVSTERDLTVLADTHLDIAISEALTHGIDNQEKRPPTVTLTVSAPSPKTARIDVSTPATIPEVEPQTIQRGYETQMKHVGGLGLWLLVWLVENANGTVKFPESGEDGVTMRLELLRAPGNPPEF